MIPSEKELLEFIKKRELVNISTIAKEFNIYNMAASELVNDLEKKKLIRVVKFSGSKVVKIK